MKSFFKLISKSISTVHIIGSNDYSLLIRKFILRYLKYAIAHEDALIQVVEF